MIAINVRIMIIVTDLRVGQVCLSGHLTRFLGINRGREWQNEQREDQKEVRRILDVTGHGGVERINGLRELRERNGKG